MTVSIEVVAETTSRLRELLADIHERSARQAYAHIFDTAFPSAQTRTRWQTYTGNVAVARSKAHIIGFIAWHSDEVDALYVLPDQAGAGVGALLLAAVPS